MHREDEFNREKKSTDEVNEASGDMKSTWSKCNFRINARKKKKKLGKDEDTWLKHFD
jgi:hypothetical protein